MTIKEAFQLLADKVGSGMKNPFFIARNLHDAFVEIEENISGGGEPATVDAYDVTYQQSNVGATLDYINQGVQYSTTRERIVGKWIDGKTIYCRVFDLGSDVDITSTNWYATGLDASDIASFITVFGNNSSGTYYPLMAQHSTGKINVLACRDGAAASVRYLVVQYTKSS